MQRVKNLIDSVEWRWAKTYAKKAPHWYCVLKKIDDPILVDDFYYTVQYIRDFGVARKFWSKEFIYLKVDNYEYWSYGAAVLETELINRALLDITKKNWY